MLCCGYLADNSPDISQQCCCSTHIITQLLCTYIHLERERERRSMYLVQFRLQNITAHNHELLLIIQTTPQETVMHKQSISSKLDYT